MLKRVLYSRPARRGRALLTDAKGDATTRPAFIASCVELVRGRGVTVVVASVVAAGSGGFDKGPRPLSPCHVDLPAKSRVQPHKGEPDSHLPVAALARYRDWVAGVEARRRL